MLLHQKSPSTLFQPYNREDGRKQTMLFRTAKSPSIIVMFSDLQLHKTKSDEKSGVGGGVGREHSDMATEQDRVNERRRMRRRERKSQRENSDIRCLGSPTVYLRDGFHGNWRYSRAWACLSALV